MDSDATTGHDATAAIVPIREQTVDFYGDALVAGQEVVLQKHGVVLA